LNIIVKNNKFASYLLVTIILLVCCSDASKVNILHGTWFGEDEQFIIIITFQSDSKCNLSLSDKKSGSNQIIEGRYYLDYNKKPIPLTIKNIPQLNNALHTILEFVEDDYIRISYFSSHLKLRPIAFLKGNSITLMKANNNINGKDNSNELF